jgi:hypothetical protein
MDLAALNAIVYRLVCTEEDPMYWLNQAMGDLAASYSKLMPRTGYETTSYTTPSPHDRFYPSVETPADFDVRILTEQAATRFVPALPKGTSIMVKFLDDRTGRRGMGETFRQMFARISPSRRAQVVFGMDQLHRNYLATTGGSSKLAYDTAEHLTDEETVKAYLALVREVADSHIMMQARVDAARARKRLAEEIAHIDEAPSGSVQTATWPRRPEALFRNHLPKSELQRILAKSDNLTGQPHQPPFGGRKVIRPVRPTE